MYIFSRSRTVVPAHYADARALAIEIGDAAAKILGYDVIVSEQRAGVRAGELWWNVVLPDFAAQGELTAKLAGDPAFVELLAKGREWFGVAEERVTNILVSSVEATDNQFFVATTATPLPGKVGAAVAYGLEVQAHIAAAGFQSMFGTSVFGNFGEVGWMLVCRSLADVDAFQQWQASDTALLEMVDRSSSLFVPASGQNSMAQRIN